MADKCIPFPNADGLLDKDIEMVFDKAMDFHDENPLGLMYNDENPEEVQNYYDTIIRHYRDNSGENNPSIIAACNRILKQK